MVTEMRDIHMVGELDVEDSVNNKDTINQNPIVEITEEVPVGPDVQAASGRELISSHANTDQQEDEIEPNKFISVETKTKQSLDAEHEFVEKVPVLEIPSIAISPTHSERIRRPRPSPLDIRLHKAHSHELVDEQNMIEPCLMNQQHPLGETDISLKTLQGNDVIPPDHCPKETEDQSIQKRSASEKTVTATISTDSETRSTSLGPFLAPPEKSIKRSVEEGATPANAKTITSSTNPESVSSLAGPLVTSEHKTYPLEDGDGQTATPSVLGVTTEPDTTIDVDLRESQGTSEFVVALTHAPVSLNEDASMKVSSIIEEHIYNPHDIGVSESKPSPIAYKSPSLSFEGYLMTLSSIPGNPSKIMEDLNFASLVKRELEQLVSNKHLASENFSLLTDFLVKHPSVHLNDKTLSNRYKGYAYNCLVELLKFLQIHSVKDVLESSHSDFVELLQDVRKFGFDKDWLDDVERRSMFPGIQVSQDALQKLLDSKRILTQHVEDLKHQVEDLKHQLASSQADLESILQQETQVLEARAALSAPIGY
ncbi:uncharacterized protein LOC133318279 [Gastrolobium bilobum]|uniref:uncharacterized protein LOC133318279 n=1 Tax=Gastrolobium bilobum TaxID=150636 RepID=UPI002AAF9B5E|nr:uncharacterized protein LOC133318279 [Gastrolobium bilobum]